MTTKSFPGNSNVLPKLGNLDLEQRFSKWCSWTDNKSTTGN